MLLLFLCLTASGYGLALIYSATRYLDNNNRNVIVQAVAICIGVVIYIVLTFVDFQLFVEKCWKWLVAFDVGFILLLLTPLGKESGGNRNWLALDRIIPHFPLDLQPNEIVKIPFILLLAWQAARIHQQERDISSPFSVAQLTGHTLLMVGLIAVVCGDIGMCVIYLFLFVTISWMAGVKARWFALGGTCFVGAILGAWFTILQSDRFAYIRNRFMVVLDHSLDPLGAGFQQSRSLLAIGSGQLTGQGYLNGTQTQASYSAALPARQTDFIFSVCGEELGMVGCLLLLLVLALIILRCYWVGRNASSPLLRLCIHGDRRDAAGPGILQCGHVPVHPACHGAHAPLFSAMAAPPSSPFTPPWASSPASGPGPSPVGFGTGTSSDPGRPSIAEVTPCCKRSKASPWSGSSSSAFLLSPPCS